MSVASPHRGKRCFCHRRPPAAAVGFTPHIMIMRAPLTRSPSCTVQPASPSWLIRSRAGPSAVQPLCHASVVHRPPFIARCSSTRCGACSRWRACQVDVLLATVHARFRAARALARRAFRQFMMSVSDGNLFRYFHSVLAICASQCWFEVHTSRLPICRVIIFDSIVEMCAFLPVIREVCFFFPVIMPFPSLFNPMSQLLRFDAKHLVNERRAIE